ncbi:2-hydroxyacid dehydrogenase [Aliamphritea spongicola]|uniref:2-hydroxyacid dehydrogenase n=1 Tax=Aliamphritea spongicola TaxID=707589 RepID=UPI00196ADDA3|nr:2-hydroxyacid dehydrogenase [Aliamphritea spongicola]MBN3560721.1 2-hydroxyacid dehydrogenase [Aliamphritea spongicola]
MNVVFLDLATLDFDDLNLASLQQGDWHFSSYTSTEPSQVAGRIRDADVVIVNKVVLSEALLAGAEKLQLVCIAATGTNNVDLAAARQLGITVTNCQAYGTRSVTQHVMAMMLGLHTNLIAYDRAVKQGDWGRSEQFCLLDYPVSELAGKTLGLVGYGELGQEVGRLAEAFGMQVLIAQRAGKEQPGRLSLDDLLRQADVLSLHCPLTKDTRDLIDAAALAKMKPGSFLINTARGGIVNEAALADALRSGHLAGAATDVLSVEPPKEGNVLLADDIPNLIITPHSAWGSLQARQRIADQVVENINAHVSGDLLRVVN